jgi:16S rRNA (cytidine1402-2'-O)-methyltransferase
MPTAAGKLYLVPAPLDFGCGAHAPLTDSMPARTLETAAALTHWVCENAKSTRAYLKRIGELHPLAVPVREQHIVELPRDLHKKGDHEAGSAPAELLAPAIAGHDLGLVSEAGMPAIADPGSSLVRAAHALGIVVIPLVGPVSLMLALAASGLNGQSFAFVGYLPQDAAQRAQRVRALESTALNTGQAQLFIETPYRNLALWQTLLKTLQPSTRLAVASGLTLPGACTRSQAVRLWREEEAPVATDTPAVFGLGR